MAESGTQPGTTRRYLANRYRACNPSDRGRARVHPTALGLPTGKAEGSADHQFPLREAALPGRPLPRASVAFFRVHRHEIAENKWKFTKAGEDWFCFAGLWRPMPEGGAAFTLLTTEPGPDVAPIHNRQMVILDRPNWSAWLDLTQPEPELLRPLLEGSLLVEQVRP